MQNQYLITFYNGKELKVRKNEKNNWTFNS